MNEKYMKVVESLGEIIIAKDLDISILKYENERLKETVSKFEKESEKVNT